MTANTGLSILNRPESLTVSGNDYVLIVSTAGGIANTKKMLVSNFVGNNTINVISANNFLIRGIDTPANGSITVITKGTLFFDDNYIYIATANNIVKRAQLNSF